ncbi:membrane integrity-associated transporter subunit PqiC [Myxococcota bacterium]|nr:membrane integrity-associated transporter subunit PqiC [Myxococcota bacterium]MCZ7620507.1 PqiC family protein [Myxococcota bacterium]
MMRNRTGLLRAVVLPALLAAGCLGRSPTMQFFTLGAIASDETPAVATRPDLGVAVGPIEFPRYLDRPEIVTRDGAHRVALSNANRWAGSLRSDILHVVADDLGQLLGTARVVSFPNEPTFRLDYRVLLDFQEFEGVPGESVTLRARWTVVSAVDENALAVEEVHLVEPAASASFEDLVAAQRAALGTMNRAIAARLATLPFPAAGAR